jgi:hypothetical protein
MYNFFVTSQDGAWDNLFYEYDRSRFLEYTNDKLSSAFKILTEKTIAILKSLPCVFAYEGSHGNIKIGQLISIKQREHSILIEYKFHPEIQEIPFEHLKKIAPILDIREWEMNRTHWAVKDEDLFERLRSAKIIPDSVETPSKKFETIPKSIEAKQLAKITTVQGFIAKVLADKASGDSEVFYRGHSDKRKYKLEPSLFRRDDKGNYIYLHNEHILYRELIISNSLDFSSDEYTLDRLVRMQHYSLPTRLLDITSNPLIALYFACKSKYGVFTDGKYTGEDDGEVIIFTIKREQIKYFDSDTASCIANLARLPKTEKDAINLDETFFNNFNDQPAIKRLTHFIREEKPFFEPKIDPTHLRKIICIKGKKTNDRIHSQSGAFLMFGLDTVFDENGTVDIQVNRITIINKASILKELDLLNINESTVFPYIENSAKYVAQKYSFSNIS